MLEYSDWTGNDSNYCEVAPNMNIHLLTYLLTFCRSRWMALLAATKFLHTGLSLANLSMVPQLCPASFISISIVRYHNVFGRPFLFQKGFNALRSGDGCNFFSDHGPNPLPSSSGDNGSQAFMIDLFQ